MTDELSAASETVAPATLPTPATPRLPFYQQTAAVFERAVAEALRDVPELASVMVILEWQPGITAVDGLWQHRTEHGVESITPGYPQRVFGIFGPLVKMLNHALGTAIATKDLLVQTLDVLARKEGEAAAKAAGRNVEKTVDAEADRG